MKFEEEYTLLHTRRNGTRLYLSKSGAYYLRSGEPDIVKDELATHDFLIKSGFPVSSIIDRGELPGGYFYKEESLGNLLGEIFGHEYAEKGEISKTSYARLIEVIEKHFTAQLKITSEASDSILSDFKRKILIEHLIKEPNSPHILVEQAYEMIQQSISNLPFCWSHGDFNPHNICEYGEVDFEFSLSAPIGYDLVSSVMNFHLFPDRNDLFPSRNYVFDESFIGYILEKITEYYKSIGARNPDGHLIALYVLRSIWSGAMLTPGSTFQKWRWEYLEELLGKFINSRLSIDIFYSQSNCHTFSNSGELKHSSRIF